MREALALAERGLGRTSPNPAVGCQIVLGGPAGHRVLGRGFHPQAGQPHAEVFALREAGDGARGATAYVTLEPCSHFGHTPPCADALIRAGVSRVVVAALDPDPRVAGRGARRLREAGVAVEVGLLEGEALRQQAGFRSLATRGRPWVVWKYAVTLDGRVAGPGGRRQAVSGPAAGRLVHRWRDELDAVGVGSGTLLLDDPLLTTRGVEGGRDPRPVIFDRSGRTPPTARALRPGCVVVSAPGVALPGLAGSGATLLPAASLGEALEGLGGLGIASLLLEGGPTLAASFLAQDLIDEVRAFVAPRLFGPGRPPLDGAGLGAVLPRELREVSVESVGAGEGAQTDALIRGYLHPIPAVSTA